MTEELGRLEFPRIGALLSLIILFLHQQFSGKTPAGKTDKQTHSTGSIVNS